MHLLFRRIQKNAERRRSRLADVVFGAAVIVGGGFLESPAAAASVTENSCEVAIAAAETRHGLPGGILLALGRTEALRAAWGRVWPWTLNIEGEGGYYESRESALGALQRAWQRGVTNIDVGCLQVNAHWHGGRIRPVDLLQPEKNADYGARYLLELFNATGSWSTAVGHYHSRDQARARSYTRTVCRQFASIRGRSSEGC